MSDLRARLRDLRAQEEHNRRINTGGLDNEILIALAQIDGALIRAIGAMPESPYTIFSAFQDIKTLGAARHLIQGVITRAEETQQRRFVVLTERNDRVRVSRIRELNPPQLRNFGPLRSRHQRKDS